MFQRYYAILEIKPTTSKVTVKKAYRKLAKKYHPDISQEPNAKEKFVEITKAYEIIMDRLERPATYAFYQSKVRRQAHRNHVKKKKKYRSEAYQKAKDYSKMKYTEFDTASRYAHPYPVLKHLMIFLAVAVYVMPWIAIGIESGDYWGAFGAFLIGTSIIGGGTWALYSVYQLANPS